MTLKSLFSSPIFLFGVITTISILALAAAFTAEAVFNLEPCKLCIYQRYPFGLGAILGLIGLIGLRSKPKGASALLSLCGLTFLINAAIAVYHTGVEQQWWISAVEGCSVVFEGTTDTKTMLENIMSAPTGSCSDIPWSDPLLNLSMANYNIILCFGLFVFCTIGAIRLRTRPSI